jgi:sugar phosphate isomerase/epimerase
MSNRRTFLQQAGLAAAGLLMKPSGSFAGMPYQNKKLKEVGLGLFTLRNELGKNVKETIAKVAQAGYNTVETYYGYGGPYQTSEFWGLDAKAFKALLHDHKLTTPSGHYMLKDFLTAGNGSDAEFKQMEVAVAVGQEYFVVPSVPQPIRDNGTADDYKFIAAQFNKAGEACKKHNLKLAYHNHSFEFKKLAGDTTGYDILLKETEPSLVNFENDLFWTVKAGIDPLTLFKQHPGRFVMWHVKDMDKTDPSKFTEVGKGSINYKDIFANSATAGMKHFFIEQDEIYLSDRYKSISQSCDYVKKNLKILP